MSVTVPGVRPATTLVTLLAIVTGANLFTEPYLLTGGGGPNGASSSPVLLMYKRGIEQGVEYLTLFAFSSENWRRPADEVSILMQLFLRALEQEVAKLDDNDIRFKVIGDVSRFEPKIRELIAAGESVTEGNSRLTLTIAANYGGRWDIAQAVQKLLAADPKAVRGFAPEALEPYLSMAYAPEPDLFIRTGGEQRISNFLLWQLAYTEFLFTDLLWPDFDADALGAAIDSYRQRERRFGRTSEQLQAVRD